jgi:hypothetical protein
MRQYRQQSGIGETMAREEVCYFCGESERKASIVPWFVQTERRTVHMNCFLAAYGNDVDATPQGRSAA